MTWIPAAAVGSVAVLGLAGVALPVAAPMISAAVCGLTLVITCVAMLRAARTRTPDLRTARLCFAGALGTVAVGKLTSAGYGAATGSMPVPSPGDAITILWVPLAAAGVYLMPRAPGGGRTALRSLNDGVTAGTALLLISWLVVLRPVLENAPDATLSRVALMAFPVCDVFVAAMAASRFSTVRHDVRPIMGNLAAGLLLICLSDSGVALIASEGEYRFGWPDVVQQVGMLLLLRGTLMPDGARTGAAGRRVRVVDGLLPYVPVVLAMLVGVGWAVTGRPIGATELGFAALMVLALVARQGLFAVQVVGLAAGLQHEATHDSLTGLANRPAFMGALEEHVAAPGPGLAVLLLDLDGFKEVNDTFGHAAGDKALMGMAARLRAEGADARCVARLGGDEFAVLYCGPDPELVALTLSSAVSEPLVVDTGQARVTTSGSCGIAMHRPGDTPSDLLRRADLAMYAAKRSPLSRTAVFADAMAVEADRRHLLAAALDGAVERGEMCLVYQPLFQLSSGELAGAEALLRWRSPQFGLVSPEEFIPLAEEAGQIGRIGEWVVRAATRQVADWALAGLDLPSLYVNLSVRQLDGAATAAVLEALAACDLEPSRLTLEVPECQVVDAAAIRHLERLRQQGVRIALDDFGSGFSSLAQLARLPVDVIKLDRDLLRALDTDTGAEVVRAITGLAAVLGLTTVAEGVEHEEDAAAMQRAGCTLAQGFHLGRPQPPAELARLLPGLRVRP